jgi:hypothetical protein
MGNLKKAPATATDYFTIIKDFIMFRLICQILSLFLFLPLASALAQEARDFTDFSGHSPFQPLIWAIGAYLHPDMETPGQPGYRYVPFTDRTGQKLTLSLLYPDPSSPWPASLELFSGQGPESHLLLKDAWPFGGPNLIAGPPGESSPEASQAGQDRLRKDLREALEQATKALAASPRLESPPVWAALEPGLQLARPKALYGIRLGPRELIALKADPAFFELRPWHESEFPEGKEGALALMDWAKRLGHFAAIFNGGQYYPDRASMGYLKRSGKELEAKVHRNWKGFMVSGPPVGHDLPQALLIDLDLPRKDEPGFKEYSNVIQSYMLLDRSGAIRVRHSYNLASRSILGQDKDGYLWAIMAQGAISMSDLAVLARELGLSSALGLDGGLETQWVVKNGHESHFFSGTYSHNAFGNFRITDYRPSLPVVITLERKAGPELSKTE